MGPAHAHLTDQPGIPRQRRSGDQVAEPGEILGRRIKHQISSGAIRGCWKVGPRNVLSCDQGLYAQVAAAYYGTAVSSVITR